jgi:hypothetical protein
LKGKAKEWYKKINPSLVDWPLMKIVMEQSYGTIYPKDIKIKLDAIKQETK